MSKRNDNSTSTDNFQSRTIKSCPSIKALGDYVFYIDLEGHRRDEAVREVLEELEASTAFSKCLAHILNFDFYIFS